MPNPSTEGPPDRRAKPSAWIGFAAGCVIVLIAAVVAILVFGIPGGPGGTSPAQQQSSGASPDIDPGENATFGNRGTRETTGYLPRETPETAPQSGQNPAR